MLQETFIAAFITGPPNGPILFCSLASVVVVCNAAGDWAGRPPGAWAVGRSTLHGGPVLFTQNSTADRDSEQTSMEHCRTEKAARSCTHEVDYPAYNDAIRSIHRGLKPTQHLDLYSNVSATCGTACRNADSCTRCSTRYLPSGHLLCHGVHNTHRTYRVGQKSDTSRTYITLYERYHFFGPPGIAIQLLVLILFVFSPGIFTSGVFKN